MAPRARPCDSVGAGGGTACSTAEDVFGFLDPETAEILESGGWELE